MGKIKMPRPRIYCPQTYRVGDEIQLEDPASRHLLKSLRLKQGDALILFNGHGGEFEAELCASDRHYAKVKVGHFQDKKTESGLNIHLVYGLARFEKTEWVIQKVTELGVNRITPVMTQHGEVHLSQSAIPARMARWRSIIISACEQSGRCFIPGIDEPVHFKDWILQPHQGAKWLFHPGAPSSRPVSDTHLMTLLVGPEGGFSDEEVRLALGQGFNWTSLGPRILRTETAAITAVATVQFQWGDLS